MQERIGKRVHTLHERPRAGTVTRLNMLVGPSCFTRCPGCYNYFAASVVSNAQIVAFLRFARERTNVRAVTFAGGDPLSRLDIVELLRATKALGFIVKLDTVGTPFLGAARTIFFGSQEVPKVELAALKGAVDVLGIPLDGSTQETASLFRKGRPYFFTEQKRVLQMTSDEKVDVCVNTVVHAMNRDDLRNIYAVISEYENVVEWQLFQFMPLGPLGYRNRDRFVLDSRAFEAAVGEVIGLNDAMGGPMRLKPKDAGRRKHLYLLVDNAGVAYRHRYAPGTSWNDDVDACGEREILGDITKPDEWPYLIDVLDGVK